MRERIEALSFLSSLPGRERPLLSGKACVQSHPSFGWTLASKVMLFSKHDDRKSDRGLAA